MSHQNLIIVESPGKVKTIQKYVDQLFGPKQYVVKASFGHVRDLPAKGFGVEAPEYIPQYEVTKAKVVAGLKSAARNAQVVYLAMDPDREGEAIAYHLSEVLGRKKYMRVVFNEITKAAVGSAMDNPGYIDMALVRAQEVRRVLDRLTGYRVTGALRQNGGDGLTAGRVQSVAVKLVASRCHEIEHFEPVPYLVVMLQVNDGQVTFSAKLDDAELCGNCEYFQDRNVAVDACVDSVVVKDVEHKRVEVKPKPPLITSTLQQQASTKLNMGGKEAMAVAQKLYEAGHITYMRTDSPNLSVEAYDMICQWAGEHGFEASATIRRFGAKKDAQEAHEAIRPTNMALDETQIDVGDGGEKARLLYKLIRDRAIASQLASGYDKKVVATLDGVGGSGRHYTYKAVGKEVVESGWRRFIKGDDERGKESEQVLPQLIEEQRLDAEGEVLDKETSPPAYFNEASIVAALEKEGVGRPSTYASIIDGIVKRGYVAIVKKRLEITSVGQGLVSALDPYFGFMQIDFTRRVESDFDQVASGKAEYLDIVARNDDQLTAEITKFTGGVGDSLSDGAEKVECSECGKPMRRIVPQGKGKKPFWGCTGYGDGCRNTLPDNGGKPGKPAPKKKTVVAGTCDECGKDMVVRSGRKGDFLGCTGYPKCKNTMDIPEEHCA